MTTAKTKVLLVLLVLSCAGAFAAERTSIFPGIEPKPGPVDLGIIFNTDDILLNIDEIDGGVGAKVSLANWVLRGIVDLRAFNDVVSVDLNAVLERHLWPGPVSVYWGPSAGLGLWVTKTTITDDDWTRYTEIPLTLGCVFGVEFFIFESLSVFVEYQASLKLGLDRTKISSAGSVSTTTEWTYDFDIGMGNSTKFGIVFYLLKKEDSGDVELAEKE